MANMSGIYIVHMYVMDKIVYLNLKCSKLAMKMLVSNVRAQIPHDYNAIIFLTTKYKKKKLQQK